MSFIINILFLTFQIKSYAYLTMQLPARQVNITNLPYRLFTHHVNLLTIAGMHIGDAIYTIRKAQGVTLEKLALHLEIATSTLSRIEKGQRKPSIDLLEKLATALHTRVSVLYSMVEAAERPDPSQDKHIRLIDNQRFHHAWNQLTPHHQRLALEFVDLLKKIQEDIQPS